jgi:hypothetical protein
MPVNTKAPQSGLVKIKELKLLPTTVFIRGTAPLCVHKFSQKAQKSIEATQEAGAVAKTKKVREPRQFEEDYENAKYVSTEGWLGVNAAAFRNAMISACKAAGFVMTRAKLGVFIEADGFDRDEAETPLVRIYGEQSMWKAMARNANNSFDIRSRPLWKKGWKARIKVNYDESIFGQTDIFNLMERVGKQVGIGEGRPDSKNSYGIGLGMFEIVRTQSEFESDLPSSEAA